MEGIRASTLPGTLHKILLATAALRPSLREKKVISCYHFFSRPCFRVYVDELPRGTAPALPTRVSRQSSIVNTGKTAIGVASVLAEAGLQPGIHCFCVAAEQGDLPLVQWLLQTAPQIDLNDWNHVWNFSDQRFTVFSKRLLLPIQFAAAVGHAPIVQCLLPFWNGKVANAEDDPWLLATRNSHVDVLEVLLASSPPPPSMVTRMFNLAVQKSAP